MAYDETLALRVSAVLGNLSGLTERKMFGGVGYMINGNMACGVHEEYLIVRVGPDRYQATLEKKHTKVFDITGRPMTGWVMVDPDGLIADQDLQHWILRGIEFAEILPPK